MCEHNAMGDVFEQVPDYNPTPRKIKRRLAKRGK